MAITAQMVKELRDATGLGMMDCKEALNECAGDMEKAIDYLRKKGLKVASKRGDRASKEGVIDSYIHLGGKIGVMVELNCETDFVARTQDFKDLAREISMQIAATDPKWISPEDVPADVIEKESAIYTEQTLAEGKPEKVVPKIVEGKLKRFYEDVCLLEQSYIRDQDKKVSDLLSAAIAKTGEMVRVRRFVRYVLGQE
ncbi:MAG TPA: translation elongation factor Ts [bacterium]|nr:translation elongation factor Ts [bacterium]HOY64574.1 translation elongation factor Ts [bacterium]HPI75988.1 translation elongation factor Ts [bacterium]HPN93167.1 translation elongation factor Ts [bacterium]